MKTSVDEGVELDYDTGSNSSRGGEHDSVPSLSSNSDYQSIENCYSLSLPSCKEGGEAREETEVQGGAALHSSRLGALRYNPITSGQAQPFLQSERSLTRSPVNFREGRRSSDGLTGAQGMVAFQQRLYDKDLATGLVRIDQVRERREEKGLTGVEQVREEARLLQSKYSEVEAAHRQPQPLPKRISVPENFAYFPGSSSGPPPGSLSKHVALQQQLLQHRLYQKRQNLQKQRLSLVTHGWPHTRPHPKPAQPGLDCLFQPIAEDETSGGSDSAWQGLPSSMRSCRVSDSS